MAAVQRGTFLQFDCDRGLRECLWHDGMSLGEAEILVAEAHQVTSITDETSLLASSCHYAGTSVYVHGNVSQVPVPIRCEVGHDDRDCTRVPWQREAVVGAGMKCRAGMGMELC